MSDHVVPGWVALAWEPPSVRYENEVWLVCPMKGFDCARVPRYRFGEQWAADVMAVHVAIHHRRWT